MKCIVRSIFFIYISILLANNLSAQAIVYCDNCSVTRTSSTNNERIPGCPICGDGVVNLPNEQCDINDFGTLQNSDFPHIEAVAWNQRTCTSECKFLFPPHCGDGVVNRAEEDCDGNDVSPTLVRDRVPEDLWLNKTCNPPNSQNPCKFTFSYCGDRVLDSGETCEEGYNIIGTAGQIPNCRPYGDPDACTFCGDGIVQVGKEACENALLDGTVDNNCSTDCRDIGMRCGDGILNGSERCDPAIPIGGYGYAANCRGTDKGVEACTYCGDYLLQDSEECDRTTFKSKSDHINYNDWDRKTCTIDCKINIPACLYYKVDFAHENIFDEEWRNFPLAITRIYDRWINEQVYVPAQGRYIDGRYTRYNAVDDINSILRNYLNEDIGKKLVEGDAAPVSCLLGYIGNMNPDRAIYTNRSTVTVEDLLNNFRDNYFLNNPNSDADLLMELLRDLRFTGIKEIINDVAQDGRTVSELTIFDPIYLDKDCKRVVGDLDETRVCGNANVKGIVSPISLLMKEQTKINSYWKIVKFRLDPTANSEQWVYWKASEEAPLLVYDPEHKGQIKDGTQLFGSYAFGGKLNLKQDVSTKGANNHAEAWRNGYEALATLDVNSDGYLSNQEMKDLALWFDKDQDAISDSGEVVKIDKTSISKIFYEYDYQDNRGDIYSLKGFESDKGVGGSVDWFSPVFTSQQHAVSNLERMKRVAPAQDSSSKLNSFGENGSNISGVYRWKANADKGGVQGLLVLYDGSNWVNGYSLTEEFFAPNEKGIQSRILRYPLKGEKFEKEGKIGVKFSVYGSNGEITLSEGLFEDSKLKAESVLSIIENVQKTDISYQWVADKIFD